VRPRALLRDPLVQFVVLGLLLFGVVWLSRGGVDPSPVRSVRITAEEIDAQRAFFEAQWRRAPTQGEFEGLVDQLVREKVMAREAVVMGLDTEDPVIRRRLAEKIVTLAESQAALRQPTPEELRAYYAENLEDYLLPPRMTFTHLFFNPDLRGGETWPDARAAYGEVERGETDPAEATGMGDRSRLQSHFASYSQAEVRRAFGGPFADSLFAAAEPGWNRPLASGYGVHVVYVYDLSEAEEPTWEDVEPTVAARWGEEQGVLAVDAMYRTLLDNYDVVVELDEGGVEGDRDEEDGGGS
jgi:hypothetical protein